jgi:HK97 family phage major capsid protein
MKRYKALLDQRAALQQEARGILDAAAKENNRKLTEKERERLTAIKTEREELEVEIAAEAQVQEWERTQAPVVPTGNEDTRQQAQERVGDAPKAAEGFASFGQMLQAVAVAAKPGGRVDQRLMAGPTGLNEGVGSDGGFLVQSDVQTQVRQRAYTQGEILKRVNKIPISGNSNGIKLYGIDETSRADGSRFGGIRSYWTAEAGLKLDSKPKFREMDMRLHKIAALVYCTDELLQDTAALEAWITSRLPDELRFKAEDAILTGTGSGMPLGVFNSGAAITVAAEGGQTAGTVVFENIVNMWARLYAPSRANAVWLVDQSVEPQLYTMSLAIGAGGIPVYMPAGGISGAPFSTLFGRPIITVEYLSQLGTKGDIVLADLSQYTVIDKGDVQQASSMHVRFLYDETVYRFVYRIDGQPEWNSPLTPKNGGATVAPFVVLASR